ncbi:aminotransferase class III-fold pyridoxal phosphate-dependent enzyme [Xenorhabdus siamensis]|uniref:aminotransferase class III-fold pyridoxal phosphate-dependent enzyme n=1 Tax=Xenorhabdus siamensis TaxID=3136254 RepID=UPI0030F38B3C
MSYMYPFKNYHLDLPKIISAKGIWLFDESGKSYIDSSSGPMTVNLGHCHPLIIEKTKNQLERLHFIYRSHFRSNESEVLSKKLIELSNDNKSHVFFLNSGSEASEAAYRIALDFFRYQGKEKKIVALGREITNHGNTITSLSYGDLRARRKSLDNILDCNISRIKLTPCYCFQCPLDKSPETCKLDCVSESFNIIDKFGAEKIACVFVEPITGSSGGALVPHKDYMKKLKEGLIQRDILLIADEIVTGLGRTGAWFNMKSWGVDSDITIIGKGLGAGFTPISGVLISKEVSSVLAKQPIPHFVGHTYSGNPLSTGIALSVLDVLE